MDEVDLLASMMKSRDKEGKDLAKEISSILIDRQTKSLFLLNLREFKRDISKLKQEPELTKTEKMVMDFTIDRKKPITRDELIEKFGKTHKSLGYETHASITLNSRVKKGFRGKSRIEGVIYFMPPEDAVSHTLSVMGKLARDIKTEDDILKLCENTGMSAMTVISVLNENY